MAQCLRLLTAVTEDLGSVPSVHIRWLTVSCYFSSRTPLASLCSHMHAVHINSCRHMLTYTSFKTKRNKFWMPSLSLPPFLASFHDSRTDLPPSMFLGLQTKTLHLQTKYCTSETHLSSLLSLFLMVSLLCSVNMYGHTNPQGTTQALTGSNYTLKVLKDKFREPTVKGHRIQSLLGILGPLVLRL